MTSSQRVEFRFRLQRILELMDKLANSPSDSADEKYREETRLQASQLLTIVDHIQ